MPKVAVVMGSDSDFPQLEGCIKRLKEYGVEVTVRVISAHRTPDDAAQFSKTAKESGIEVIIAAAGKAAHLGGVLAASTTLPVIGVPIKASTLDGLDALLSIVQMPKGIPVATVAIDGGDNAAILALQILALKYHDIEVKLEAMKEHMAAEVRQKDHKVQEAAASL